MSNWVQALEQVAQLRDKGILSDEEFAAEKQRILASRDSYESPESSLDTGALAVERRRRWSWIAGGGAAALVFGALLGLAVYADISPRTPTPSRQTEKTAVAPTPPVSSLPSDTKLDEFLRFASASTCEPGPQLSAAVHELTTAPIGAGGGGITLSDLRVTLPRGASHEQPKVDGSGATVTETPLRGVWHGLHVTSLRSVTWDDTGFSSFQLRFSETAPDALSILKQAGFPLTHVGEIKTISAPNDQGAAMGVEQLPEGSALTCARGLPSGTPTADADANSSD
jgi:hypothetical protein